MKCPNPQPSGTVYDPFAGSGTSILAAEKTGRQCFAMEIEPEYCLIAAKRWLAHLDKTQNTLI